MLSGFLTRLKAGFTKRFLIKAGLLCGTAFVLGGSFAASSYSIGFETQNVVRCLPQVLWLLDSDVDTSAIEPGSLVKLNGADYNAYFDEEIELLKMVVAVEGDTVTIDAQTRTMYVNGEFYGKLAATKPPAHNGDYMLAKGQIWIAGTSDTTIDSRYFGPATLSQIKAHAYAIL